MARQTQKYTCEKCGVKGEVIYFENQNNPDTLLDVFYKIEDDHKKQSPKCKNPTSKLLLK